MKNTLRAFGTMLVSLFSLCLLLSAFPMTVAAGESNITMTVSATEVEVGELVTVTLTNRDMNVISFTGGVSYDLDRFTCEKIVGEKDGQESTSPYLYDGEEYIKALAVSSLEDSAKAGTVGFAFANTDESHYEEHVIVVATFRAISGGEASFTLYESADGTDEYTSSGSDKKTVTVTGFDVSKNAFELSHTAITLMPGSTKTLTAEETVTWSSDKEAVATVNDAGVVTAVGDGTAIITATATDGRTAVCVVTVGEGSVGSAASGTDEGGLKPGMIFLIAIPTLLVIAAVVVFILAKKKDAK